MRFSVIVAPVLLAAVNAQQPTDAIGSAAQIVSLGNAAISQAASVLSTNAAFSVFTASAWGSVTAQIGSLTRAAATNPQASQTLASIVSQLGPQISSLSRQVATATVPTGAGVTAASSIRSSVNSVVSAASSSFSSALSAASASASSAAATPTRNAGMSVEAGAAGVVGVAVLGLAAFL